jgi:hypothetical protein
MCFKCLAAAYDALKLAENRDGIGSADEWAEKVAAIQKTAGLPGADKMKVWVATAIRAAIREDRNQRGNPWLGKWRSGYNLTLPSTDGRIQAPITSW